jgi:DNA-binding NarL/FixJ family response regulator
MNTVRGPPLGAFLIVEDNQAYARAIVRALRRWGAAIALGTVCDARAALVESNWRAIFLDLGLPDGTGMDVLVMAREAHPATPVLILSADSEPVSINRACSMGAHYAIKPVSTELIEHFVEFTESFGMGLAAAAAMRRATIRIKTEKALLSDGAGNRYARFSPRELAVVVEAALGAEDKEIAVALGCSVSTVRTMWQRVYRKAGSPSRRQIVASVWQEALRTASDVIF